jgi:hypothetical protein
MLAITGFFVFLGGGALAYSAAAYPAYERAAEVVAGILLMAGLALLGIGLQVSLDMALGH